MPFEKGKSGNPGGRKKEKPWADALRRALFEEGKDGEKKLFLVARAVVDRAIEGDIQAAKEIGDRLDGKAIQQLPEDENGQIAVPLNAYVILGRPSTDPDSSEAIPIPPASSV